jgi:hypothetical protein
MRGNGTPTRISGTPIRPEASAISTTSAQAVSTHPPAIRSAPDDEDRLKELLILCRPAAGVASSMRRPND